MQVFSGEVPFSDRTAIMAVFAILGGERPPRPAHPSCTDDLWVLIQRCWAKDPHSRPEISEVLQNLP